MVSVKQSKEDNMLVTIEDLRQEDMARLAAERTRRQARRVRRENR